MGISRKRAIAFGGMAALVGLTIVVGLKYLDLDALQETTPKFYQTFDSAEEAGATKLGWLPPFLPRSAYSIYEKHNLDYNRVIVAFRFSPSDFQTLIAGAHEISLQDAGKIWPTWLVGKEPWFSQQILEGRVNELSNQGFRLYEVGKLEKERILSAKIVKWYIAVNPASGIAYVWS